MQITLTDAIKIIRERQSSFVIGSVLTIIFNGISIGFLGISTILISRVLGPEQSGYVVWFITGTTTISMFADILGIYYSNSYLLASGYRSYKVSTIHGSVLIYGALVGLLTGTIFSWPEKLREIAFNGFSQAGWGILICFNISALVVINQIRGILVGESKFILLGLLNMAKAGGYAVLVILGMYGFHWKLGVKVAIAQVAANWLCVLGFIVYFVRQGLSSPSWGYLKDCFGVGWRGAGINWLSFLHQRVDQYLVNVYLGSAALGLYGATVSMGELLTQVPSIFGLLKFPAAAKEGNQVHSISTTIRQTLIVMLTIGVLISPLYFFADQAVVFLYGPDYLGAAVLLRYFMPAIVFLSGLLILNQFVGGLGYPKEQLIIMLLALLSNIGLNLILLHQIGLKGASLASSISYGLWFLLIIFYLCRKMLLIKRSDILTVRLESQ